MATTQRGVIFVQDPKSRFSSCATMYDDPHPLFRDPLFRGCLNISADGDRISFLPVKLLYEIVGRLPIKDAARTAVLSMRWRYIWASFPLVLDDADLLSDLPDGCDFGSTGRHTITDAISSILTWHPGPFRFVRLIHSCSYATTHNDGALLKNWLGVLSRKGVEELVLFHPLSNTSGALPNIVLRISSVRCLDLRNWNFPSTRIICRDEGIFPNILELGLWHTDIGAASIDHILQYSPRLERFALIASYNTPRSVLIRSRSLLCLLFWNYIAQEIHVLAAPRLKRLILRSKWPAALFLRDEYRTRLIIGCTQKLEVLGYLDTRIYELHIFNTLIKTDTVPSQHTVVPSVKVLALKVRIGVPKEANMVPSYLRCFPNVEILHVMFDQTFDGELNSKLWEEAGPIICLRAKIKKLVLKNFQGKYNDLAFFMYVWERAEVLEKVVVVLDEHTSRTEMIDKIKSQVSAKRVFKGRKPIITVQSGGSSWTFHVASDLSVSDPFVLHSFLKR